MPARPRTRSTTSSSRLGREGLEVVRLKGGDPMVFGRGGEEAASLRAAGVPHRVVPGVTSAIAAPAAAGIPVTLRGVSAAFTVVSGHEAPEGSGGVAWEALGRLGGTIVVLMATATIGRIAERLVSGGLAPDTPVAAVTDGTLPEQVVWRGTLAQVADAGVRPPADVRDRRRRRVSAAGLGLMASGVPLGRASGSGRMHKSSVYLPEALKARLAALARRSGRSEAQLLRLAVERLVAAEPRAVRPPAPPAVTTPSSSATAPGPASSVWVSAPAIPACSRCGRCGRCGPPIGCWRPPPPWRRWVGPRRSCGTPPPTGGGAARLRDGRRRSPPGTRPSTGPPTGWWPRSTPGNGSPSSPSAIRTCTRRSPRWPSGSAPAGPRSRSAPSRGSWPSRSWRRAAGTVLVDGDERLVLIPAHEPCAASRGAGRSR